MKGIRLSEITWQEAPNAVRQCPVALLPVGGGTKAHGPHLPLGTDLMVVEALAERVVEAAPVLLLPALAYAYYPAFVDWPGSVSIAARHFAALVADIIRSLHRHGIHRFLILDGGVSTYPPLDVLSRDLHETLGVLVAVTNIRGLGYETHRRITRQKAGGHADEIETSRMLAIRPELVKMKRAVKGFTPDAPGTLGPTGIKKVHLGGKLRAASGVSGDPTLATRQKGEQSLEAMVQDLLNFVEGFINTPLP